MSNNSDFTGERMIPDANREDLIFGEHIVRYLIPADLVEDKVVLDVACGSGYGCKMLSRKAKKVCGLDNSKDAIEYARQNYSAGNIEHVLGDAIDMPYEDKTFDTIVSFETIEHLADYKNFLSEIRRVTKDKGLVFISTPVKDENAPRNIFHVHEFGQEEFESLLKKYYQNVKIYNQNNFVLNSIYSDLSDINKQDNKAILSNTKTKYMYAICSDGKIPDINLLNLVTSPSEIVDVGTLADRNKIIEEKNIDIRKLNYKNKVLSRRLLKETNNEKELSDIKSSTSWKITKPLRWLGDTAKSLPKDIKSGLNVLQKEGLGQFLYRLYWYILGKKTMDSIPPSARNCELINYLDKPQGKLIFKKFENPEVSIVVPVYNQWKYTYSCLFSILENSKGIKYEIIIADDNSTDKTVNIENVVSNITVVKHDKEENLGFVKNCNNSAKVAKGKYILLLNNDTNVQPGWLDNLLELIKRDEKIGIVGSKLIFDDNSMQEAGSIIWNDATGWNYGRGDDPALAEYGYVKEVDYVSGACILFRADLWRELGGFDERFSPGYYEETDAAFRARQLGYKVMYQPESRVLHFESKTFSGNKKELLNNHRQKFWDKWKDVLKQEQFAPGEHVFWARDRSQNKKTLLYIDHHVPMFDQDAGSRATWYYLQMFVDMGLNVKFMGNDFYAHEPYTTSLQQLGIEVLYGSWYQNNWQEWIMDNSSYFDYVILSRPRIAAKYIDFILENTGAKVYYMAHDLHFLRQEREAEVTGRENVEGLEEIKALELDLMAKADKTFLFSTYEQERIRQMDQNLDTMTVPLFIYDEPVVKSKAFNERKDLLFVGGFNHPPNVDAAKYLCHNIFPLIKEKLSEVKLYIVGSQPTKEILSLAGEDIIVAGYVDDERLKKYYRDCRLAVMPLRYGAGVKGKVIESVYYNLPMVTSSIGAEGLPDNGDVLIIADEPDDFAKKVVAYYQDEGKYNRLVNNFTEYINANFSKDIAGEIVKKEFDL